MVRDYAIHLGYVEGKIGIVWDCPKSEIEVVRQNRNDQTIISSYCMTAMDMHVKPEHHE